MILSLIKVVIKAELVSLSNAGPLSSIESSIVCTVSETAEKGTVLNFSNTSIRWQAARDDEREVNARDALFHAEIQDDDREAAFEDC